MNQKDLKIIAYLRNNARMPLTKMSRKIHIPVSTIFDRLKANEERLITKHTSLLNFAKLGYNARANISIKITREDRKPIEKFLINHNSVNSLYRINNDFDYMIEGIFKHISDMQDFLDDLEQRFNVQDKKTHFIIEDLKKEGFMSDMNMIEAQTIN